jgi:hypothetical protein
VSAPTDRADTRNVKQLIAGATASLTGRERGPDKSVRRDSYDIDDPRAQVFRPIGDGTIAGAMGWIDALLQTAREFDRYHKKPGQRGGLGGPYVITVLEALLGRRGVVAIDFKSGRLDPALTTLEKITGYARGTIVRALAKLREHGFLDWVRRSRKTGNDREFGPQREQTSNAYFFSLSRLPKAVLRRFLDLVAARRAKAAARAATAPTATQGPPPPRKPANPELASTLQAMADHFTSASPPDGLYPHSGVKG